jgi:glycosyl hydrolase family 15
MEAPTRIRGVALSEVCPCVRYYEFPAECHVRLDGPALRSTALITYANWLLADGNISFVTNTLWPVIQLDLDYVATWWNQTT